MIRFLVFLALVLGIGWAFAWLADRPGDLVLTFGGMRYALSLTTALAGFLAAVVTIMLGWWIIRTALDSPQIVRRFFRARRRDRGYQALSTGLIAAGAGNAAAARQLSQRAASFLSADQEPLIQYLDAQVALLDGKRDDARKVFEGMLAGGETRVLGLRGLFLEAERAGDRVAARHYAEKALESAPALDWAADAALAGRTRDGDWDKALTLVEERRRLKTADKATLNRQRAVLLTAKAIAALEGAPADARAAALEANKLAPDLVPAAVIAARSLFRLDELRKGAKILEAAWKVSPHPEIADAYVHARSGDSAADRLARARELEKLAPGHAESLMAVAQAELAAGEHQAARRHAEALLKTDPRESAWLLLADIEEAETGHQGRVREWLQRAVKAPRDPAWVADGQPFERWLPFSPVSGRIDAFEWKAPAALLAGAEIDAETMARVAVAEAPSVIETTPPPALAESGPVIDAETVVRSAGYGDAGADSQAQPEDSRSKTGFRLF